MTFTPKTVLDPDPAKEIKDQPGQDSLNLVTCLENVRSVSHLCSHFGMEDYLPVPPSSLFCPSLDPCLVCDIRGHQ